MTRRRKSLLAVLALIFALILIYVTGSYYSSSTIPNIPDIPDEKPDIPDEKPDQFSDAATEDPEDTLVLPSDRSSESSDYEHIFVVPEIPLGTLGAFSGLASSFGIFVLRKRAK